jgi:nucleotide sugar dehydrogenase
MNPLNNMLMMPGTMGGADLIIQRINKSKSEEMNTIGIIGLGYVGGAIKESFDWGETAIIIDPAKGYNATYQELKEKTDGVFVCVPSPMGDDGSCDTSILESVLEELKSIDYRGVIISKCTAPPSVYERLGNEFPNLVHAPEFLTAANANRDYANGKFSIIGGNVSAYIREAERIIRLTQRNLEHVKFCSIGEAALAKYTINSFLATKVIFMNELYTIAKAAGLDYKKIVEMVTMDPRIGTSHMQVPGLDGAFGFGGACFPKDTAALLKYAEGLGQTPMVLDAAVRKNTLLRLTEPK